MGSIRDEVEVRVRVKTREEVRLRLRLRLDLGLGLGFGGKWIGSRQSQDKTNDRIRHNAENDNLTKRKRRQYFCL